MIAAGRANHAGPGSWLGIENGNGSFIGIEAENTGLSNDQPWPEVQMDGLPSRRGGAPHASELVCGRLRRSQGICAAAWPKSGPKLRHECHSGQAWL